MDSTHCAGSSAVGCESNVRVREVSERDLDRLFDHRNDPSTNVWLGTSGPVDKDQHVNWFYGLNRKPENFYGICSVDGVDIGLIRLNEMWDGRAIVGADVFKEHRGLGHGSAIFGAACNEAIRRGATRELRLWVFLDNEAAIKIYRRVGFHEDPNVEVKWFVRNGRPRAYVLMRKELKFSA